MTDELVIDSAGDNWANENFCDKTQEDSTVEELKQVTRIYFIR